MKTQDFKTHCNGYKTDVEAWEASYVCGNETVNLTNITIQDFAKLDSECTYYTSEPPVIRDENLFACTKMVVSRCPKGYPENDAVKLACDRYALHVGLRSMSMYKNEHCARCNGRDARKCSQDDVHMSVTTHQTGNRLLLPHFDSLFQLFDTETRRPYDLNNNLVKVGPGRGQYDSLPIDISPECGDGLILRDGNCTFLDISLSALPQLLENRNESVNILTINVQLSDEARYVVPISVY